MEMSSNSSAVNLKVIEEEDRWYLLVYSPVSKVTTPFYLCSHLHHSQMWPLPMQGQQIFAACPSIQNWKKHRTVLNPVLYKKQAFLSCFSLPFSSAGSARPLGRGSQGSSCPRGCPRAITAWLGSHQGLFQESWPPAAVCVAAWPNTQGQGSVATRANWFCAGTPKPVQAAVTSLDCSTADISQEHLFPWGPAEGRSVALVVLVFCCFFF